MRCAVHPKSLLQIIQVTNCELCSITLLYKKRPNGCSQRTEPSTRVPSSLPHADAQQGEWNPRFRLSKWLIRKHILQVNTYMQILCLVYTAWSVHFLYRIQKVERYWHAIAPSFMNTCTRNYTTKGHEATYHHKEWKGWMDPKRT